MRWLNTLLTFILVFTVGSIAFTLLRKVGEEGRQGRGKVKFQLPKADIVLSKVRFVDTRGGRRDWVVESHRAQLFKEKNRAVFEGVHITFFGEDGRETHLFSNRGELNTQTRAMEALGDVRGRSSDGLQFFTSSLHYDADRREITTDAPVRILGSGYETQGVGMVVDMRKETVRLLDQVRSRGAQ
ncbi:MAG: LPS export ABC transporter periplasmic protein LptC [Deltaproteobacteria bacterium RBG_13_65_10]|jgi:LPS export ABC transporter protein LptC|nr:MAG: LPS export ABC transporter periplasmic protein LptC [Deltaproteobacteria bacterium RBG_13_65_10]